MKADVGLTTEFFDNEEYSDVIIKFGEEQIRAHKIILAQQSGYFAAAFFGLFQVTDLLRHRNSLTNTTRLLQALSLT